MGPFELRQLGRRPGVEGGLAYVATAGLVGGHWIVLDDVFMVAACPTREAAEAAMRLLSGACDVKEVRR